MGTVVNLEDALRNRHLAEIRRVFDKETARATAEAGYMPLDLYQAAFPSTDKDTSHGE